MWIKGVLDPALVKGCLVTQRSTVFDKFIEGFHVQNIDVSLCDCYELSFFVKSREITIRAVKSKGFYLFLFSIALRSLLLSPLGIC